jgi:hypothetical protein
MGAAACDFHKLPSILGDYFFEVRLGPTQKLVEQNFA